jgi:hypothetical protein
MAVTGSTADLPAENRLKNLAGRLERAFVDSRNDWWSICRRGGDDPGAAFSHAVTAGSFGSDLGLMLAWTRLVDEMAAGPETIVVICNDAWLFRHLATRDGVQAGIAPALWPKEIHFALRGWLARSRLALRLASSAIALAAQRPPVATGDTAILVYGHPDSDAAGNDTYFGDLMKRVPTLKRVLHTDAPTSVALRLGADGRTTSLHAWGSACFALIRLPWTRWQPRAEGPDHTHRWLLRRAAARENSGGGPAMNRWQQHCQERWLIDVKPTRVLWPWENHGWERALCRAARKRNIKTIGYQHTVVGPHQLNYAVAANPDGVDAIPDQIACDGPAYHDELKAWGVPAERLVIAGAFRFRREGGPRFDPAALVFVPLSAIPEAAAAQVLAARRLVDVGFDVVIKDHPMYPFIAMGDTNRYNGIGLQRTTVALRDQKALSAVLYSTGTSGLEALLAGIPTVRLMLDDRIAIDVLPNGVSAQTATIDTVVKTFEAGLVQSTLKWDTVLSPVDDGVWHYLVNGRHTRSPAKLLDEGIS